MKALPVGEVLPIKHKREPQPFHDVWAKTGGLEWFSEQAGDDEWRVWVRRVGARTPTE